MKLCCGRMQTVRQIVSAPSIEDRIHQFLCYVLHFGISGRSTWLTEKHNKGEHILSGIVEECVMVPPG